MRVSAVMPVYNGDRYLAEALDSIDAQTRPVDEIVVVDDGSTDGSAAIVAGYPKVRYLHQPNAGCAAARNRGVAAANGDAIAFIDQDDRWLPGHLARMVGVLEREPQLGFVACAVANFLSPELTALPPGVAPAMLAVPQHGMGTNTLVIRRTLFESIGTFDPSMVPMDDSEWLLRAVDAGVRFVHFDEPTVSRRIHAGNQSILARGSAAHAGRMARALHASLKRRRVKS
ncbi:MAG: glycosyltransferase family A protein [Betaproteobacteria bacterium]